MGAMSRSKLSAAASPAAGGLPSTTEPIARMGNTHASRKTAVRSDAFIRGVPLECLILFNGKSAAVCKVRLSIAG
jgi:hypothetical protein